MLPYEVDFETRRCVKMRLQPGLCTGPAVRAYTDLPAGFGERNGEGEMERARAGK